MSVLDGQDLHLVGVAPRARRREVHVGVGGAHPGRSSGITASIRSRSWSHHPRSQPVGLAADEVLAVEARRVAELNEAFASQAMYSRD